MILASCPSIKFHNIVLKHISMSKNIFVSIVDKIMALDFSNI